LDEDVGIAAVLKSRITCRQKAERGHDGAPVTLESREPD
jgi:hypothetical protein